MKFEMQYTPTKSHKEMHEGKEITVIDDAELHGVSLVKEE